MKRALAIAAILFAAVVVALQAPAQVGLFQRNAPALLEQPEAWSTLLVKGSTMESVAEVQYRSIPGFTGYRVGDDGSVWSRRRTKEWTRLKFGMINGYCCVVIREDDGRAHKRFVQRLVLEAFVGPCPPGMEACHDPDNTRTNNRLSNLRWDTRKANNADQVAHGTRMNGEKHPMCKLKAEQVIDMRERFAAGETAARIAAEHGMSPSAVVSIVRGRVWAHVGGPVIPAKKNLSPEQVRLLKQLAATHKGSELSKRFGVSQSLVSAIINGHRWSSVSA